MTTLTIEELKGLAEQTSIASVSDVMKPKAYQVIIPGLIAVRPEKKLFGQAVTVRSLPAREDCIAHTQKTFANKVPNGDPMMYALQLCGPGKVLVVDASGYSDAAIGGDMKFAIIEALGGEGLVTDGAIRDQREFREEFNFATYCKGFTPLVGTGRILYAHDVNVDINCGGTLVRPNDYIFGDGDGVIVIPETQIERTLNAAIATEKLHRYIRDKSVREKVTYGDIVLRQAEWIDDYLAWANLTPEQKVTLEH
ncbi:MAG: RraA family protein [Arenicellales bacterium]|nr:RraA family protein [Arenicellales bacterium]